MKIRKIRLKFITQIKLYMLFLATIFIGLSLNTYSYVKNEVSFTSNINQAHDKIRTNSGEVFIFADSVAKPKFVHDYVATMKNDTVVSYRRKLDFGGEMAYMFGGHEHYRFYQKDNLSISEDKDANGMGGINVFFWGFTILSSIVFIVTFISYIGETSWYYHIPIAFLRLITSSVVALYLLNYAWWLSIFVIVYVILELIIFYSEDSDTELKTLGEEIDDHCDARNKIKGKKDQLHQNFEKILYAGEKESKKETKEKDILYI